MSSTHYISPQKAEDAFYQAFEQSDFNLMSSVWADESHIECIHPMSDRLSGKEEVLDSWRSMFQQPLGLAIKVIAQRHNIGPTLAVHIVDEHITLIEKDSVQQSVIHATNVYELKDKGWQMILHHASPSRKPQHKQRISSDSIH